MRRLPSPAREAAPPARWAGVACLVAGLPWLAGVAGCNGAAGSLPPAVVTVAPSPATAIAEPVVEGSPVFVSQSLPPDLAAPAPSPDGALLAFAGPSFVYVLDAVTGEMRATLRGCARSAAFTPDGSAIVVLGCSDGDEPPRGTVWDLRTDRATRFVPASRQMHLDVSPWARWAALHDATTVQVVDAGTGAVVATWNASASGQPPIASVVCSLGSLATVHADDHLEVWGVKGEPMGRIEPHGRPRAAAFSPIGDVLATGSTFGLTLWDPDTCTVRNAATPCDLDPVTSLAWSGDGQHLAVGCEGLEGPSRVRLLRADLTLERDVAEVPAGAFDVSLDPEGRRVAASHAKAGAFLWDVETDDGLHADSGCPVGREPPCWAPRWSRDLSRAVLGAFTVAPHGTAVRVLDTATKTLTELAQLPARGAPYRVARLDASVVLWTGSPGDDLGAPDRGARDVLRGERVELSRGDLSGDGRLALRAPDDHGFELTDLATRAVRRVERKTPGHAYRYRLSRRGGVAIELRDAPAGRGEALVTLWDTKGGKPLASFATSPRLPAFDTSPDDALFAAVVPLPVGPAGQPCLDRCTGWGVQVRSLPPRAGLVTFKLDAQASSCAFGPDGRTLIVGGQLHDARTGKVLVKAADGFRVSWFTPDGARLLLRSRGQVRALDPRTWAVAYTLADVDRLLDASGDGSLLLTVTGGMAQVWDARTGAPRPAARFPLRVASSGAGKGSGPADEARQGEAAFSADGKVIYFAGAEDLGLYRVADGRVLYRRFDPILDVTDEGVFDGEASAFPTGRFRLGPSVARGELVPLERYADALRHPGLLADLLAGQPVSPAR